MMEKQVLREVTREEAKDFFGLTSTSELPIPVPSKLVLTRKPMMDPAPSEASASNRFCSSSQLMEGQGEVGGLWKLPSRYTASYA